MTTSVVMCTYNGEKYIEEQLRTILRQTRKPDEVIITDDHSMDRTAEIIKGFIHKHGLEKKWHLYENKENVGWKKNFMTSLKIARGDVLFLADQDDIWHPRKIEIISEIMEGHSEVNLLACDCYPFDSDTGKRKRWFLPVLGKRELNKVSIRRSFADCLRPGCTHALRGSMRKYIDSMWEADWSHDQFFWCIALAQGRLYNCRKVLVKWRRTKENSSPKNDKTGACRVNLLKCHYGITKKVLDNGADIDILESNKRLIGLSALRYRERIEAIENRNYLKLLTMIRYIRSYPKSSAWAGDLLAAVSADKG